MKRYGAQGEGRTGSLTAIAEYQKETNALVEALERFALAETNYRLGRGFYGARAPATKQAWDELRSAAHDARTLLASLKTPRGKAG